MDAARAICFQMARAAATRAGASRLRTSQACDARRSGGLVRVWLGPGACGRASRAAGIRGSAPCSRRSSASGPCSVLRARVRSLHTAPWNFRASHRRRPLPRARCRRWRPRCGRLARIASTNPHLRQRASWGASSPVRCFVSRSEKNLSAPPIAPSLARSTWRRRRLYGRWCSRSKSLLSRCSHRLLWGPRQCLRGCHQRGADVANLGVGPIRSGRNRRMERKCTHWKCT